MHQLWNDDDRLFWYPKPEQFRNLTTPNTNRDFIGSKTPNDNDNDNRSFYGPAYNAGQQCWTRTYYTVSQKMPLDIRE